jgi:hypothetical protein
MKILEKMVKRAYEAWSDYPLKATEFEAMRSALEAAGVAELIEALNANKTILEWFADERNWRSEQLSEGFVFSAEWKIGFDPMELARQAKTKSDAALAKVLGSPTDDARTAHRAAVEAGYADLAGYIEKHRKDWE